MTGKNQETLKIPLGFRVPRTWQGSTSEQILNSAEQVILQGGNGRMRAAQWAVSHLQEEIAKRI